MHYLVTGGAGFIGSHVVDALVAKGRGVRVLDNFFSGKMDHLAGVLDDVEIVEGDVRDVPLCREVMEGIKVVIHLAALHEVPRSVEHPMETHDVNVTGTLNLLLAARDAGAKRFVIASSSAVYGDNPTLPRSERMTPAPGSSPYATSKLICEYYGQLFSSLYGVETVVLRLFNVYGVRQSAESTYAAVIPKFLAALLAGTPPTIYGDGEQSRDFLHIADCVSAILSACDRPGLSGEVLNVGTGERTTVNQLSAVIQELLDVRLQPRYESPLPGDVRHDQADIKKARRLLGFIPAVDLRSGLRETLSLRGRVNR